MLCGSFTAGRRSDNRIAIVNIGCGDDEKDFINKTCISTFETIHLRSHLLITVMFAVLYSVWKVG
jgi:hypothetical protein